MISDYAIHRCRWQVSTDITLTVANIARRLSFCWTGLQYVARGARLEFDGSSEQLQMGHFFVQVLSTRRLKDGHSGVVTYHLAPVLVSTCVVSTLSLPTLLISSVLQSNNTERLASWWILFMNHGQLLKSSCTPVRCCG